MKFRIHFDIETKDFSYTDCVDVTGDTVKEILELADKEVEKRGGKNPWSEEIK